MKLLPLCLLALILFAACSRKEQATQPAGVPPAPTYFKVDPQTAGVISGKVLFAGKTPPRRKINLEEEPLCAKQHAGGLYDEPVVTGKGGALANAFVYIKQGLEDKKFEPPAEPVVIDQKGCWFGPRVLGIQVGQTLKVTNSDPVTHNIHPLAKTNREWNQSQAPGEEPFTRRFTQPEVMIRVKCNIHSWMKAWVGAVAHPYFAVTGADGAFQLRNVPPGTYTLEVWQEELGTQTQQVTVAPAGKGEVVFKLNEKGA